MLITGRSSLVSFTCLTSGTLISRPNSITCAVSMKMISSTSTTSTSGTMLISDSVPLPAPKRRRPNPLLAPLPLLTEKAIWMLLALEHALRRVQELEREILHARAHHLYAIPEIVVKYRCRDGGEKAQCGRKQRVGNTRCHGSHTGGPGHGQGLESLN